MANNWHPGRTAAFDQNVAHYDAQAETMIDAWQVIGEQACCVEHHHVQFFEWLEPQLATATWHDLVAMFTIMAKKAATQDGERQ